MHQRALSGHIPPLPLCRKLTVITFLTTKSVWRTASLGLSSGLTDVFPGQVSLRAIVLDEMAPARGTKPAVAVCVVWLQDGFELDQWHVAA